MNFRVAEVFKDPTPDGYINLRYVAHMLRTADNFTDLSKAELDKFLMHLIMVAKKMAATWMHLDRYLQIETGLIEAAEASPPIETLDVQHLSYSQDLFLEVDEFLVQLKSTLDYLAQLPIEIVGKKAWPYLRTFGEKGTAISNALKNNIPEKWRNQADGIEEFVMTPHKPWLEMAIASRDRSNHHKDGGVPVETFLVAKMTVDGSEKVVVPMWLEKITVREYLTHTWYNLMSFVEQFTIGFLSMRFRPGIGFAHLPGARESVSSPIFVAPNNAVEHAMKVMSSKQQRPKQKATTSQPNE